MEIGKKYVLARESDPLVFICRGLWVDANKEKWCWMSWGDTISTYKQDGFEEYHEPIHFGKTYKYKLKAYRWTTQPIKNVRLIYPIYLDEKSLFYKWINPEHTVSHSVMSVSVFRQDWVLEDKE